MDAHERDLLAARVCSGTLRLRLGGRLYVLGKPGPEAAYVAAEAYQLALEEALDFGAPDEGEAIAMLLRDGLWDESSEKLFSSLPKEIEDFKVGMYKATFRSSEREALRKYLAAARSKLAELSGRRGAYSHVSAPGLAAAARARCLLGSSLLTASGGPAFPEADYLERDSGLLDEAMLEVARLRITDPQYRELARTEPFRGLYAAGKGNVFDGPSSRWTDEQRALAGWAGLYENVHQHHECPPESVIEDDDCLDGWMIDQRRKREDRLAKSEGGKGLSEKTGGAQEVFVPADTAEDAQSVFKMNDGYGQAVHKQRFSTLKDKGQLDERDMPDTRLRVRMEQTARMREAVAGAAKGGK